MEAQENNRKLKQCPVQGDDEPTAIPWWLAEIVFEGYVNRYGETQNLECIAKRGGFGKEEVIQYIRYPHRCEESEI